MKKFKTQLISYTFFTLCFIALPFINSCGNNPSDTQVVGDCGASRNSSWTPNMTNTFVDAANMRVYQFSAIPGSEIEGICTKSKPTARGHAAWNEDTLRHLSIFLAVRWSAFGADEPGTISNGGGAFNYWDASYTIGLQQAYGDGPGKVGDLRIDVKFPSTGSALQDSIFFAGRSIKRTIEFDYEDYIAP